MPRRRTTGGKGARVRTSFMTEQEFRRATARKQFQAMKRASAYLMGIARRTIRRSKKPSKPGKPPHTRKGQLKRAVLFAVEGRGNNLRGLIGPSFSGVGRIMIAHEYGVRFQGRDYPERALMVPALEKSQDKLPSFWRGSITK